MKSSGSKSSKRVVGPLSKPSSNVRSEVIAIARRSAEVLLPPIARGVPDADRHRGIKDSRLTETAAAIGPLKNLRRLKPNFSTLSSTFKLHKSWEEDCQPSSF
jgi:hypothetical protein